MTGSSVNFQIVTSASHAVSHASRSVSPSYLLSADKSLGTIIILDDVGKVAETLEHKLSLSSRQAKASKNYSPVWEGVLNLPRPNIESFKFNKIEYKKHCSEITKSWIEKYEETTGHKVLRADIHLDEGHIENGKVLLNAHAHIISDRTNEKGKVLIISPRQMRELQTITAEVTKLERGINSKISKKQHINAHVYKALAEKNGLDTQQRLNKEKAKTDRIQKLFEEDTPVINRLNDQNKQLKIDLDAALLAILKQPKKEIENDKSSHPSRDSEPAYFTEVRDVHEIDNLHDIELAESVLRKNAFDHVRSPEAGPSNSDVQQLGAEIARLKAQIEADYKAHRLDKEVLKDGYNADRDKYKSSTEKKTQQDYQSLKTAHLGELEALTKAHAEKVKALEKELAKAQEDAAKVPGLVAAATGLQAQIYTLTPLAALVPGLKKTLDGEPARLAAAVNAKHGEWMSWKEKVHDPMEKELKSANEKITSQADYQALKKVHATTQQEADKVPSLEMNLKTAQQEAIQHAAELALFQAEFAAMVKAHKEEKEKGNDPAIPIHREATPAELADSLERMVDWVKEAGGERREVGEGQFSGSIHEMDGLHCIQKISRSAYTIHRLSDLDKTPATGDTKTTITYPRAGGVAVVTGKTGKAVER